MVRVFVITLSNDIKLMLQRSRFEDIQYLRDLTVIIDSSQRMGALLVPTLEATQT